MSIHEPGSVDVESATVSRTPPVESEMRFYEISMPTEPGWYWFNSPLNPPLIFHIREFQGRFEWYDDNEHVYRPVDDLIGQWYGPAIPEPPAQEKTP